MRDNCECLDPRFGVPFQYPFSIGKHSLNIAMHGDKYELRVDGMSFSHMYSTTKMRSAFREESAPYNKSYGGGGGPQYDDDFGPS